MRKIDKLKQLPLEEAFNQLYETFQISLEQEDLENILTYLIQDAIGCYTCILKNECRSHTEEHCYNRIKNYLLEEE